MKAEAALAELGLSGGIDVASRIASAPDVGGSPGKTPQDLAAYRAGHGS